MVEHRLNINDEMIGSVEPGLLALMGWFRQQWAHHQKQLLPLHAWRK